MYWAINVEVKLVIVFIWDKYKIIQAQNQYAPSIQISLKQCWTKTLHSYTSLHQYYHCKIKHPLHTTMSMNINMPETTKKLRWLDQIGSYS